jgi:hypothetical protein
MVVVCTSAGVALAASGCLSGDDTAAPPITLGFDAGTQVPPIVDASGVDGTSPRGPEAGVDAAATDGATPDGATAGGASTLGLVGGGVLSQSAHYTLVGATGPATAPILQSPKYQLTGGMAVTK